ncbi:PIGMENT DEFECTIVE 322, chloroplast RNA-binding protein 33 [Hibiscus trionum]|uniref:PIGMENT DEFECTIVE 322, chloroplast RNA-binding protein 33 n=1 Tax=Hibiscus trionum TaxID=183268 RepID=A0A9W7MU87_HIBTR|nr:PIGMENT DEFECTIVE 322, chloroplast RNA-binding protein 33 [Hibiscus trionum]
MSAPTLSMAAAVAAASFSLYNNTKPSSLFSSSIHFLPSKHNSKRLKPFNLKTQCVHPLPLPLHLSLQRFPCFSASFDSIQATHDDQSTEEQYPETESRDLEEQRQQEEAEEKVLESGGEEGKLYVGNLPYSITSSELSEIFSEAGGVAKVEIVYDRVTDRSRGFGFVTMGSVDEAKEAIRLFDGSQVGGRTVKVNFPEVPRGGEREVMGPRIRRSNSSFMDSPYKIYAGNLSWGVSSEGLRDAFASQPGLLSAKVIYERDTGRSRGFGFVTFESAETVEAALSAMNGVEVEGRPLRLNMAADRASPAPSPETERNAENSVESSELLSSATV